MITTGFLFLISSILALFSALLPSSVPEISGFLNVDAATSFVATQASKMSFLFPVATLLSAIQVVIAIELVIFIAKINLFLIAFIRGTGRLNK